MKAGLTDRSALLAFEYISIISLTQNRDFDKQISYNDIVLYFKSYNEIFSSGPTKIKFMQFIS